MSRLKSVAAQVEKAKANGEKFVLVMRFAEGIGYEYKLPEGKSYGVAIVKKGWLKGQAKQFYEELEEQKYTLRVSPIGIEIIIG